MRLHRKLPCLKQANITRYTFDAWKRCFPQSNYNEWYAQTYPDNLLNFLRNAAISIGKNYAAIEKTKFMVVTINEEYFRWIQENKLEDTVESRTAYASQITEADAVRLLLEEKLNVNYEIMFLYAAVMLENDHSTNFMLSDEIIAKLKIYLESIYKSQEIFIPGYILKTDTAVKNSEKLLNLAKAFFDEHQKVRLGVMETQEYAKGANLSLYFIPVILKREFAKAVFEFDEIEGNEKRLFERYPNMLMFDQAGFMKYGISGVEEFVKTDFYQDIKEVFYPYEIEIIPNLVSSDQIIEIETNFVKELRNMGAKILHA